MLFRSVGDLDSELMQPAVWLADGTYATRWCDRGATAALRLVSLRLPTPVIGDAGRWRGRGAVATLGLMVREASGVGEVVRWAAAGALHPAVVPIPVDLGLGPLTGGDGKAPDDGNSEEDGDRMRRGGGGQGKHTVGAADAGSSSSGSYLLTRTRAGCIVLFHDGVRPNS